MIDPNALSVLISSMVLSVALFGVAYCLTQHHDRPLFRTLAWFLAALGCTEAGIALGPVVADPQAQILLHALWMVGIVSVAPFMWAYVRALTTNTPLTPQRFARHAVLPALGLLAFLWVAISPPDVRLHLLPDPSAIQGSSDYFRGRWFEMVFLVVPLQWVFYLSDITRLMLRYRSQLMNYFASTEQRELQWVAVVIGLYAVFLLGNIASLLFELATGRPGLPQNLAALHGLILASAFTLWGMRQRRTLPDGTEAATDNPQRYVKSALPKDMSLRIAAQLHKAMAEDKLYLDANLSLWGLARHIRTSERYVTQVLNEEIGEHFFDFVNRHRIEAAQHRLQGTSETILSIAFEVGFNSRSSFYTAFKKVTGVTPSGYRKSQA